MEQLNLARYCSFSVTSISVPTSLSLTLSHKDFSVVNNCKFNNGSVKSAEKFSKR